MAKDKTKAEIPPTAVSDEVKSFIASLSGQPDPRHVITGMVKQSPESNGILIAHPGDCRRWAHVPAEAIESIATAGRIVCGAHTHPLADVHLKPPASPVADAWAAVANLHRAKIEDTVATAAGTGVDEHGCGPNQQWGRDQWGNLGCQG